MQTLIIAPYEEAWDVTIAAAATTAGQLPVCERKTLAASAWEKTNVRCSYNKSLVYRVYCQGVAADAVS